MAIKAQVAPLHGYRQTPMSGAIRLLWGVYGRIKDNVTRCCARVMLGVTRTHAGRHGVKVATASRDGVTWIALQDEWCRACGESIECSGGGSVISTNIACLSHLVAHGAFSTGTNHSRS
jgi:hypothetical protein